ncbi:MAG: hydrogenase expression/formation protein HypE, partial [Abditibacteriota bacterium]|nr:hydrogenase expression/formation protein HypE [Abditibacteriota bacterium]
MKPITLSCGGGGRASYELLQNTLLPILGNGDINGNDSSVLGSLAVSTDSFVVTPLFFSGKSIGTLAAAGSVNDVLASGALPLYLTCALIIEEGFPREDLERILKDLRQEADANGVKVIGGDTKVVPKGQCDGVYINTTCIGRIINRALSPALIEPGDRIIVTGNLGDHECSLISHRSRLTAEPLASDCAGLAPLLAPFPEVFPGVKAMRDPTRGGIAATLNELALQSGCSLEIDEESLPADPRTRAFCDAMGLDLACLANEGKMLIFVPREEER